jgi:hypothetical protein
MTRHSRNSGAVLIGLLTSGLFVPMTASAQTSKPVYREIGDWLLACDNMRDCLARHAPEPEREPLAGEDRDAGFDIVRTAGPAGALVVRIRLSKKLAPAAISVPGGKPVTMLPWQLGRDGEDASLSGEPARRFVRNVIDAPVLQLGRTVLSLKGLAAVLLAMDEVQGRIGNASALVRPGPRPASATPAAPPLPLVRVGLPAPALAQPRRLAAAVRRLNAHVLAAHECDIDPDALDEAYPLTRSEALVLIGCGRFAYQTSVLAFRTPRDDPARAVPLELPEPRRTVGLASPDLPAMINEFVEGSYDPATRVFSEFSKGRGMADCGSSTKWTFDGAAFRLSAFRWQDRCAGGQPGDWPVLYRTRR